MQIGEFAKLCGTRISVLRHYDKCGLLTPVHTDSLTGYRYYSPAQARLFRQISLLKEAGFSLSEIRMLLEGGDAAPLFAARREQLHRLLRNLEQAEKLISGGTEMEEHIIIRENIDLPFVNDERVIGKWRILGVYAQKEDFYLGKPAADYEIKEFYFLPEGEHYWCFGWTKGCILVDEGDGSAYTEPYTLEQLDGRTYLFVEHKSYEYRVSGKPDWVVMEQVDHERYTPQEIARKDDVDLPFVSDDRLIGRWKAHSFLIHKEQFPLPAEPLDSFYWKSVEFLPGGNLISDYADWHIEGDELQRWTKGFILRKWNSSACACELRELDGRDYLIVEWKSGDYRWGGFDTNYYVFTRD